MRCSELAERLTELMEGELTEPEEAKALEHLASCPSCEKILAGTRDVVQIARYHGRVSLSEGDQNRLLSSLLAAVDGS